MKYWLVKSPFKTRSWEKVLLNGSFELYGIRNHQAAKNIQAMKPGDQVLYYWQKQIWGVVLCQNVFPDASSSEGKWWSFQGLPEKTLVKPVSLSSIRGTTIFKDHLITRQPRVSVIPLMDEEFNWVVNRQ